ncbi:MAG: two pore domain potassium channel family protein [Thermoleophilaceae bacterium]|nr:two pore domain potassium channel family protein [Thermoleophilaceae bacterium]
MIARLRGSHRYGLALVAVAIPIAFAMSVPEEDWSRLVTLLLFSGAALFVFLVAEARRAMHVAIPLVAVAIVAGLLALDDPSQLQIGLTRACSAFVLAMAPFALARGLARQIRADKKVTLETVFGAVAIYLLIGALFATVDAAVENIGGDPFFVSGDAGMQDFLYFSFITLTTTGYGDLVPALPLARTLAVTEALLGQIYLVTVIAVLVSNIGRARPSRT